MKKENLQNLNFDYDNDTLKHTYLLDDKVKNFNKKINMGNFQPFITKQSQNYDRNYIDNSLNYKYGQHKLPIKINEYNY